MNGNRVKKTIVGGSSTYYINGYDGKTEVVSHVPTGSDFTYNVWGNDLIGQVRVVGTTATRYYYLKDHLGNIRMTVNSAGNAVSWDDYYPFGSVMPGRSQISSADNRYKFTGKERDTETNYDYFGARYYDSRIARWLQVDPLDSKYPEWSPYNYTLNNPIRYFDPDGRWVNGIIGAAIGATTEIASQMIFENKSITNVNYDKVLVSAGIGALSSGTSSFSLAGKIITNGLLGIADGVAKKTIDGQEITTEGVVVDGLTNAAGTFAGDAVEKMVKNGADGQVLKKISDRTEKISFLDPSSGGRRESAEIAKREYQQFGSTKGNVVSNLATTGINYSFLNSSTSSQNRSTSSTGMFGADNTRITYKLPK